MTAFRRVRSRGRAERAQTFVEFALVAPIFFALLVAIFSVCTYVLEVQVANDAAQTAARWGVLANNFAGSPAEPQCPSPTPPRGMIRAAQSGAGPFAGSITWATMQDSAAPTSGNLAAGTYGCEVRVTIPYVSFGGYFGLGPHQISATAVDYVD